MSTENTSIDIFGSIHLSSIFMACLILVITILLAKSTDLFKSRLQSRLPDFRLTIEQFTTVLKFIALLVGLSVSIFAIFGFSREVMVAVGGSLAVAIGFGFKDVAASILAGFLILFERPFQVGDRVTFHNTYGDVVSIGLRSTQIRTLDDSIVTVPNNQFITESVASANAGELDMMAQMDFYIQPNADLQKVETIARECVLSSRYLYLKKPFEVLFSDEFQFNLLCTRLRIKAYVLDTSFEKKFHSDLTIRLHEAFKHEGIELAG
jgi:small-conductance mechanosensitive channel